MLKEFDGVPYGQKFPNPAIMRIRLNIVRRMDDEDVASKTTLIATHKFSLVGQVPNEIFDELCRAVELIPRSCFFDSEGHPSKMEVSELDRMVSQHLVASGRAVDTNFSPFQGSGFHCDIAMPDLGLLIEIEKGKSPRLELDIIKLSSACIQSPDRWKYGIIIVPSSYIKLTLAGRQSPVQYLKRLSPLITPLIKHTSVNGIGVLGYEDPRG